MAKEAQKKVDEMLANLIQNQQASTSRHTPQQEQMLPETVPSKRWGDFQNRFAWKNEISEEERAYWARVKSEPVRASSVPAKRQAQITELEKMRGKRFVASFLQHSAIQSGKNMYFYNSSNTGLLADLINYFAADPNGRLDLKKGLWIWGERGCGKTLIMEAFSAWTSSEDMLNKFKVKSCKEIEMEARIDLPAADKYKQGDWCWDDLGEDEKFLSFGTEIDIMRDLLTRGYNRWQKAGRLTHVTSNMPIAATAERYGDRIESRVHEMFNVIFLDAPHDYRKISSPTNLIDG